MFRILSIIRVVICQFYTTNLVYDVSCLFRAAKTTIIYAWVDFRRRNFCTIECRTLGQMYFRKLLLLNFIENSNNLLNFMQKLIAINKTWNGNSCLHLFRYHRYYETPFEFILKKSLKVRKEDQNI